MTTIILIGIWVMKITSENSEFFKTPLAIFIIINNCDVSFFPENMEYLEKSAWTICLEGDSLKVFMWVLLRIDD